MYIFSLWAEGENSDFFLASIRVFCLDFCESLGTFLAMKFLSDDQFSGAFKSDLTSLTVTVNLVASVAP